MNTPNLISYQKENCIIKDMEINIFYMSQPLCQLTGFLEVFYIATKQNLSSQEQSKHEPWKIKEWG